MSSPIKLLLPLLTLLGVCIGFAWLAMPAQEVSAQQLPLPPDLLTCCEQMNPGGKTIAGPSVSTLPPTPGRTVYGRLNGTRDVCITIQNISPADSTIKVRFATTSGGITPAEDGGRIISERSFGRGQSGSYCAERVRTIELSCERVCTSWWRVDDDSKPRP